MSNALVQDVLKKSLIYANLRDTIPFKKKIVCYENFYNISFMHFDLSDSGIFQHFASFEVGTSVCLNIDKYYIPTIEVNNNNNASINGTIISLTDKTFTVQLIKNEKLVDVGLNSIPLILSFANGSIQIGKEALKLREKQNSYVISDLIKMLKTPAHDLKAESKWGFEIIKDENDEILLEFDTFRGRRKAAPTFLFAFFIRYSIKAVEAISGQMSKTIVIVTKDLTDNFRDQLMASCKSSKLALNNIQINEYKIVEIND